MPGTTIVLREREYWHPFVYENTGIFGFNCGGVRHRKYDCSSPSTCRADNPYHTESARDAMKEGDEGGHDQPEKTMEKSQTEPRVSGLGGDLDKEKNGHEDKGVGGKSKATPVTVTRRESSEDSQGNRCPWTVVQGWRGARRWSSNRTQPGAVAGPSQISESGSSDPREGQQSGLKHVTGGESKFWKARELDVVKQQGREF